VTPPLRVPDSFRAMPRWWHEGEAWLDGLPALVAVCCEKWHLAIDGAPWHGSNALVVSVRRADEPLALRLAPPGPEVAELARALRFWRGYGVVAVIGADLEQGALLLERLDGDRTLAQQPLIEAMPELGRILRRLAIPAPADVRSTNEIVRVECERMPGEWERLGCPFSRATLNAVLALPPTLLSPSTLAVNGDLHSEQVLASADGSWVVVDPVLLRGDPAYDLARILWTRLDEMADAAAINHWLGVVADAAGIDVAHARRWVLFRTASYWLWGLAHGLTEDPVRCGRLIRAIEP
jgi:streptomycin 6-kinase